MAHADSTTGIPIAGLATRRLRLESKKSLEGFLASVERRAYVMARMATGGADDAMDIVQDAMLLLVRHYGTRPENEWAPLFHRILQRRIYDWYRRTRVRNRWRHWFGGGGDDDAEGDPLENLPDPSALDPADENATDRTMSALAEAVAQLPARQQQAFLLRAWEGLDVEQTARAMGCTAGSVKTHYSRAVHALRDKLKDHWS